MFVAMREHFGLFAQPFKRWARLALFLLLLLAVSACGRRAVEVSSPGVPTSAVSPTNTLQQSVATSPASPAPTVTVSATETTGVATVTADCEFDYFFQPAPETCPAGEAIASPAAEQPFEGGVMIWLEATGSIIVFFEDGRWQRFEDTWAEGQPENDPAMTPPEGLFQPIRGFGKLWREQPQVREALGWALGVELGFESMIQEQAPSADQ
ncbi:MAG: hypothetical protein PVH18_13170, partial [Chloroflexota bacterium]